MENSNQQENKDYQQLFNEYYYSKETDTMSKLLIDSIKGAVEEFNEVMGKKVDINDFYRSASYALLNIIADGNKEVLSDEEYDFIAKEGNDFLRNLHSKFTDKTGKKISNNFYILTPLILCDIVAYENFRTYKEILKKEGKQ